MAPVLTSNFLRLEKESVEVDSELDHRLGSYTQTSGVAEPSIGSLIGSLEQNDILSSDVGGGRFQIRVL